jgi:IS30 family transposase
MPRTYEHLNQYEREVIAQMLREQSTWIDMGKRLNRSASSIWREYHRNQDVAGRYAAGAAHRKSMARRKIIRRPPAVTGEAKTWIESGLKKYWSPDQVNGRGVLEGRQVASTMSIYRFLSRLEGQPYRKYLRGAGKERQRRRSVHQRIHERVMIDERPGEVLLRRKVGHWEADTVRGPMKTKPCIMSVVERATHYLVARLLKERQAHHLNRAMKSSFQQLPFKTVTVDNGMEFASHKKLQKQTGVAVYFAHERCPWERGLNEQVNGLLRQFFPKGTDLGTVSAAQLRRAVSYLNHRPRKSLGYQTPNEEMQRLLLCT